MDTLLKELGRLGLGADSADVANNLLQPARSDAAIASVDFVLLFGLLLNPLQGLGTNQRQAPRLN